LLLQVLFSMKFALRASEISLVRCEIASL